MVCDKDCFHCKYDDCICDEFDDLNDETDEMIFSEKELKRKRYAEEYRKSHRAEACLAAKMWKENNRERYNEKSRRWNRKNRDKKRLYDRKRYLEKKGEK